ncbi:hypothetical protein PCANC_24398 [Puccinia coronata f. sp. avenae]|uniref:Uncharacterized protein n=1 Tax=Puccinia coronata f. sp. avenae TaxID=200324 RepID=A0A2N5TYJ7_9BASI|nr:hypothetical protein PCANC_24398 [Puccinia coronata f. sp. avenae]
MAVVLVSSVSVTSGHEVRMGTSSSTGTPTNSPRQGCNFRSFGSIETPTKPGDDSRPSSATFKPTHQVGNVAAPFAAVEASKQAASASQSNKGKERALTPDNKLTADENISSNEGDEEGKREPPKRGRGRPRKLDLEDVAKKMKCT